jgi:ATP-dependent Clp protease protease subunit
MSITRHSQHRSPSRKVIKMLPVAPGKPSSLPRAISRVMNRVDLPALPVARDRERVHAFTDNNLIDRFNKDAAGVRALEKNDNVITIFDVIGEDFWSAGITAKSVASQLRAIGGPVEVQINSPGGDVFEGFAIYNVLREHPYDVTVKVLGMAASAASVVAMAGNRVEVGVSAFVMIHNCWVLAIGNRHDMRETADFLEPFDKALRDVYRLRTDATDKQIADWMDAETYFSGQEAVDNGFADGLLPSDAVKVDQAAAAQDRDTNVVRAIELTLVASGLSRTQARERIQTIKAGKLGAAGDGGLGADTPGAVEKQTDRAWIDGGLGLLAALKAPRKE